MGSGENPRPVSGGPTKANRKTKRQKEANQHKTSSTKRSFSKKKNMRKTRNRKKEDTLKRPIRPQESNSPITGAESALQRKRNRRKEKKVE